MFTRTAAFWNAPAPPRPAGVPWWDLVLAAALVPLGIWEALQIEAVPWRPVAMLLAVLLPVCLTIRRSRPLLAFLTGVVPHLVLDLATIAAGVFWTDGSSGIAVLLLGYSLFRWGAGRDAAIGLLILAAVFATTLLSGEVTTGAETIAAAVVLLFMPTVGAAARFRNTAHHRALDQVRLLEREGLARDLHDTVAHYVSAIAIQAQAGRAVAAANPAAAVGALGAIEEAASKTLSELRTIVSALRDDADAELTPQRGVSDLEELAAATGPNLAVHVTRRGDLADLRPSVGAAVYRLVQESITNAVRHAAGASRIDVVVTGGPDAIRVVVIDDGTTVGRSHGRKGFGLAGMAERAVLLGGTFTAGPGAERGWCVEALLPRIAPLRGVVR